jgi:hypothetical protein
MIGSRISPRGLLFGVAAAISLVLVPTAAANTNLVPNPGFETNCSGVPCSWVATSGATIVRDTTGGHNGSSASMKMTMTGSLSVAGAGSACVNMPISPGMHDASLWYLASNPLVASVELAPTFYSGANCTGLHTIAGGGTQTIDDGTWRAFQLKVTSPAASSVLFVVNMTAFNFPQTPSLYIDDVDVESEATTVTFASASATRTATDVLLHWNTGTEADLLGFHVYRSRGHSWRRITRSLIVAKDYVSGAAYRYLDGTARRGFSYRYRIKAVQLDGTTRWFGPLPVM